MGIRGQQWGVAWKSGPGSELVGEEELEVQLDVELELELELELGLLVAALVGASEVVHKSFIKPVHNLLVHKSVQKTLMTAISVL